MFTKDKNNSNYLTTFLILVYLMFLGISYFQYAEEKKQNENFYKKQELNLLQFDRLNQKKVLDLTISDLKTIENLPDFKDYLLNGDQNNKKKVKDLFYEFSINRKIYDQIRFLDSEGQEKIRVNFSNGQVVIVDDKLLQNKKGRYYFDESFALNRNSIYISPLDLNIEQNKIEDPYKPMLRIAIPVFSGNEKKGILVLNYLAQQLLDELNTNIDGDNTTFKTELLNSDGYWLNSNEKGREWAFMFEDKKNININNIYPELWKEMQTKKDGQIIMKDGLYTFSNIIPVSDFNLEWKIYRFVPNSVMYKDSNNLKKQLIYFNVSVFILLLIVGALNNLLSKRIKKEILAEKRYQYLFDNSSEALMTLVPPDWKFSDGNLATIKIFGLKNSEELKNVTPGDLSPQYQPDGKLSSIKAKEMIDLAMKNGKNTFDWVHKKFKGDEFLASVTLNRIDSGREKFLQAIVRDVSEDKKREDSLRKIAEEKEKALVESERMNKVMIGRELEMVELKKEIQKLKNKN